MSSIAGTVARRAFVRQPLRNVRAQPRRFASNMEEAGLDNGPKRDPELYVLLGVMAGAFGLAGWYFGSKPTSTTSQSNVRIAESAMPWEVDEKDVSTKGDFKYSYHPHGDKSQPLKQAPSALNEVVVPNVTLPASLHEQFNKYGKDL